MRGIKDFNFDAFYAAEKEVHDLLEPGCLSQWGPTGRYRNASEGPSYCPIVIFNPARRDHEKYGPSVNKSETGDLADLPTFDLREALGADLEWIANNATHIYMLDGWENSKGACAEKALAEALNLTVLYQTEPDNELVVNLKSKAESLLMASDIRAMIDPYPMGRPELWAEGVNVGDEVRITSETGGQKGQKLSQMGALDPLALKVVGEVAGFGARKYARYNYLRGYDWSLSYDAGQRHLMEFWSGNDLDEESGLPHVAHAAWQALALLSFYLRGIGTDDRPPKG